MRPRYNPVPTAQEKAYHLWLMERLCVCGCGRQATLVHHPLTRHGSQRWRRDHEYAVPMANECHVALHMCGNEKVWRSDLALDDIAHGLRIAAVREGVL
jgi:hypothetical protein